MFDRFDLKTSEKELELENWTEKIGLDSGSG